MIDLRQLKASNPDASPAELFDIACTQEKLDYRWATVDTNARCNWMDMMANAATSQAMH